MGAVVEDVLADLREIDRMAQWCVSRNIGWIDDPADALSEARSAILFRVAEAFAGGEVTKHDLIVAGKQAVRQVARAESKDYGQRAAMYWDAPVLTRHGDVRLAPAASDSMEDRVVERIALREVLASLPVEEQTLLLTYVAHGDAYAAAAHLGITPGLLKRRLRVARIAFFEAWFDWEPTPRLPVLPYRKAELATHCGRGHEFTPENTGYHRGTRSAARTGRYCKACVRINQRKD